ncbi:MAG: hypothetical protein ACK46Q_12980 [Hyphomonas sp.]
MMIATATSLAAMMCNGCISNDAASYTSYSTPAPASDGVAMAMPGYFGHGPLNTPSTTIAATMGIDGPAEAVQLYGTPNSQVTVQTAPVPRSAFSLTGTGYEGGSISQNNFAWGSSHALSAVAAEIATARYGQPVEASRDMSLGLSIDAPSDRTGLGFDVSVVPRYAVRDEGDLSTQRLGGEVRFGQSLGLVGEGGTPEGWYFFVGADGEALVWDNSRSMPSLGDLFDMQMTDQVTVGDLQAGFSIQRGPGQLSLSYIRREVKFDDRNRSLKDSEDFAGITFTMRR